jgi:hypothetical protein
MKLLSTIGHPEYDKGELVVIKQSMWSTQGSTQLCNLLMVLSMALEVMLIQKG